MKPGTYWIIVRDDGLFWADLWSTQKEFCELTGFKTPWTRYKSHAKRYFELKEARSTCPNLRSHEVRVIRVRPKS